MVATTAEQASLIHMLAFVQRLERQKQSPTVKTLVGRNWPSKISIEAKTCKQNGILLTLTTPHDQLRDFYFENGHNETNCLTIKVNGVTRRILKATPVMEETSQEGIFTPGVLLELGGEPITYTQELKIEIFLQGHPVPRRYTITLSPNWDEIDEESQARTL